MKTPIRKINNLHLTKHEDPKIPTFPSIDPHSRKLPNTNIDTRKSKHWPDSETNHHNENAHSTRFPQTPRQLQATAAAIDRFQYAHVNVKNTISIHKPVSEKIVVFTMDVRKIDHDGVPMAPPIRFVLGYGFPWNSHEKVSFSFIVVESIWVMGVEGMVIVVIENVWCLPSLDAFQILSFSLFLDAFNPIDENILLSCTRAQCHICTWFILGSIFEWIVSEFVEKYRI